MGGVQRREWPKQGPLKVVKGVEGRWVVVLVQVE